MAALLLIACLSLALIALAVRRALPIALACLAIWATRQTAHDLPTACMAGVGAFALCSALFDRLAMSQYAAIRFSIRGVECIAGASLAVFMAWSFARALGSSETMAQSALLFVSAAILGGLIVTSRYRIA